MSAQWDPVELAAIGAADELRIASRRRDGSLSTSVTIWCVALHGVVVVRSAYGAESRWYRRALARGAGRISAAGIERDVRFQSGDHFDQELVDEAYRRKYARYPDAVVRTVAGEHVHGLSLIVTPSG